MNPENATPALRFKSFEGEWEKRLLDEIAVRSSLNVSDDNLPNVEYQDIIGGTGELNTNIKTKEVLRNGFESSMLTLAAYDGDELLGVIRTVGDGHTIVFVQNILVFPEHQRKGIGSTILQAILDRYSHVRQIEVATDNTPKTIVFYKSMGFREMSEIGCCGFMKM